MKIVRRLLALILLVAIAGVAVTVWAQRSTRAPAPAPRPATTATAVFAGGCFWCTESDFDHIPGVLETLSGYTGGRLANPTYEQVSAGGTGHYEAVRVVYDPRRVSFATLVERFFPTVDPLDGGGQFCDRGDQYLSAIFVANPAERRIAEAAKARVERRLGRPIATRILPRGIFYRAEAYHQDYYRRNSVRYRFYRWNCGRDARLREVWGGGR
jgi:peptide-methionine (S)-S-oxide reductase